MQTIITGLICMQVYVEIQLASELFQCLKCLVEVHHQNRFLTEFMNNNHQTADTLAFTPLYKCPYTYVPSRTLVSGRRRP